VSISAPRILVVEDEPALRGAVAGMLRQSGFVVGDFPDGADLQPLVDFAADLAVLDIMLPGMNGVAIAASLRQFRDLPVVFLTARDAVEDRLGGFAAGADDYVTKPFVLEELLARVRAVLRRTGRAGTPAVVIADLVVDEGTVRAIRGGQVLDLTPTEFRLLGFLVRNQDRVLSKTQLLTQVWGYDAYDPNLVEVHVSALRRKLEAHGPRLIHTVRGVGYRLCVP